VPDPLGFVKSGFVIQAERDKSGIKILIDYVGYKGQL
jgi:hypothetical protein